MFGSDERPSESKSLDRAGTEASADIKDEKNACNDEEGRVPMSERQVSL